MSTTTTSPESSRASRCPDDNHQTSRRDPPAADRVEPIVEIESARSIHRDDRQVDFGRDVRAARVPRPRGGPDAPVPRTASPGGRRRATVHRPRPSPLRLPAPARAIRRPGPSCFEVSAARDSQHRATETMQGARDDPSRPHRCCLVQPRQHALAEAIARHGGSPSIWTTARPAVSIKVSREIPRRGLAVPKRTWRH
jgi:hypothetical protein